MKIVIGLLFVALVAVGFSFYKEVGTEVDKTEDGAVSVSPSEPISSDSAKSQPTKDENFVHLGDLNIESAQILVAESFPVQVSAQIKGTFPDACTGVGNIEQEREGETIFVRVGSVRPKDALCAQVITPFDYSVSIDVLNLPKGQYTIDVNGIKSKLILNEDNTLRSEN